MDTTHILKDGKTIKSKSRNTNVSTIDTGNNIYCKTRF